MNNHVYRIRQLQCIIVECRKLKATWYDAFHPEIIESGSRIESKEKKPLGSEEFVRGA